jgi:tRNA 5-methylaminomethyl-2-thiouridine biosynthesis bifunctional protein
VYDLAVIGAGVNGCSVAYEFTQQKKSVIVFDMEGIAAGGSGAAGAFVAPKFSKAGELKELIHNAFVYSMEYYEKNFKQHFKKTKLMHIAKDEKDSEVLKYYKAHTPLHVESCEREFEYESICLDAGLVDAASTCRAMADGARFVKQKVDTLVYDDGLWVINETYSAKDVVLASGAYEAVIKEPYIALRGVWGHRIDVKTSTKNKNALHQYVSISPSYDGLVSVGATHNVHYHPQSTIEPYNLDEGREELLQKAAKTIKLDDVEVVKDYTGLRSGSFDYMPIVGQLVLSSETLECCERKVRVKKPDYDEFVYYPNLYMINGNGGYGFVLAPYIAKMLSEYILKGKKIDDRLSPARFFARWAKRS